MIRNLFISLLVAVFAASFMYLGELSGVTASNEEVAAVESCIFGGCKLNCVSKEIKY